MSYVNPIWLEGRRRYWQRHDWQRYLTPAGLAEHQRAEEEAKLATRRKAEAAEQEEMRETLLWLRRELAEVKFALAMRRIAHKYDPNQPRAPKGDPKGGQWVSDAGRDGPALSTKPAVLRRGGHHYVARQVYKDRRLTAETRKVFEEATTGKLEDKRTNVFNSSHRAYNRAVNEQFDRFLTKNNISEEQMTPDHARQLLKEIITSRDPPIRNFNMRMWMHEIFRGGRFRGNE